MSGTEAPNLRPEHLRHFGPSRVGVRLNDGSEYAGSMRTELLTDRSISVFLAVGENEGTTLYIDQIAAIWLIS
jgi:hypothetical protein